MISVLGENIKKIREEQNMSVLELSKLSSVGASTISQIETGKRQSLRTETLQKISKALKVTSNELLSIEEGSYEVSELEDAINFILQDDDIAIDGTTLSSKEREQIKFVMKMTILTIKNSRE